MRLTHNPHAYWGWANFPVKKAPVIKGADALEARKRLRISQIEFAEHMGVSSRTVQLWEQFLKREIKQPCFAREINAILLWSVSG